LSLHGGCVAIGHARIVPKGASRSPVRRDVMDASRRPSAPTMAFPPEASNENRGMRPPQDPSRRRPMDHPGVAHKKARAQWARANPFESECYCMTTRVTRRFFARPSLVWLSAIGLDSP
jgi:hypothetical protein